ncbi:hypothetical protein SAMN05216229_11229 [Geopseudomonas sagittaria]|jgi:hypothetical protein|uniref:Uncharacterized protein n=1 Tax=Geopseudomonas sagittaria TaxID=1135990 RepID=A0A1I5W0Y5_9GAMM|nr:hypothetical protein [Pseudomonas sagittaria]SFQ13267.1 hypothetical protein SAMN05216229_11229 [Pseudomonas sagittaria]
MQTNNSFTFDPKQLEKLIAHRASWYAAQEDTHNTKGALVNISEPYPMLALKRVVELTKAGYELAEDAPCNITGAWSSVYLLKPAEMQQAEIEEIKRNAEIEYRANLESEKARYIEEQAVRMLAEKKAQAELKQAALDAKALEQLKRDLAAQVGGV